MYIKDHVPNSIYEQEVLPDIRHKHGKEDAYFVNNRVIAIASDESDLFSKNISFESIQLMDILGEIAPKDYPEAKDWLSNLSVYIINPDEEASFEGVTLLGHFADFDENMVSINETLALHAALRNKQKDIYAKRFMEAAYLFIYPYTPAYA